MIFSMRHRLEQMLLKGLLWFFSNELKTKRTVISDSPFVLFQEIMLILILQLLLENSHKMQVSCSYHVFPLHHVLSLQTVLQQHLDMP